MPYIIKADSNIPKGFRIFFLNIQNKLTNKHIKTIFENSYTNKNHLESMGEFQFKFFEGCFLRIN